MRFVLNVRFLDSDYPADVTPIEFWRCVASYLDDYKGIADLRVDSSHLANDEYYYLYFNYYDENDNKFNLGYICIPVDEKNFGDYLPFRM